MKYQISFTDKEITPWAGLAFLHQMMDKMEFRKQISDCSALPQPGSNRGYKAIEIIEAFMVSIWCGANRFYTRRLPGMIMYWERFSAGNELPETTHIKDFSGNLTLKAVVTFLIIFLVGSLKTLSLIVLLWIVIQAF